jgi:hypothetical protein
MIMKLKKRPGPTGAVEPVENNILFGDHFLIKSTNSIIVQFGTPVEYRHFPAAFSVSSGMTGANLVAG